MHRRVLLAAVLLNIFAVSVSSPPQSRTAGVPARQRIVVVISLDGFPGWAFANPMLPVPTLRRLARDGVLAKGMSVSNPAVTWPNHTTLVTGVPPAKHGVLFNGLLVREGPTVPPRLYPWRDKSELVKVPTVYDLAHTAGLTTAQVDWIPTQNAGTIRWEFPERPNPEGAVERSMVADGLLTREELEKFSDNTQTSSVWRDERWTNAAIYMIKKYKPNLLLLHLLNTDGIHHRYGPRTPAGYTALAYADTRVREVLDAVNNAGFKDRATLLIVSDHGFKTSKRTIRPNAALRRQGMLKSEGSKVVCDAYVIPEGGIAMVFVTNPENRQRMIPRVRELFRSLEGIERVLEPSEYGALGMPQPAENNQMGDLVLVAKEDYAFAAADEGEPVMNVAEGTTPGHHGALSTDPAMDAMFLAWGYGIRPGIRLERVSNLDVAPTIAHLLQLKMEGVSGTALSAILK